jgi:hypothetical protein
MQTLREQLYSDPDFSGIETVTLDSLFCSLREYALQKGGQRDYDEAQKARDLSDKIRGELAVRNAVVDPTDPGDAESKAKAFDEFWKREFEVFDSDSAARAEALEKEQEDQRQIFEVLWQTEMPPRYRKPSTRLLHLRRMEKCLAVCAEFEQAKAIHSEAEELSVQEWEQQQALLIRDYEAAKRKLLAKQEAERELLQQTRQHERAIREEQCDRERDAITNRAFVVDVRKKEIEKGYRTVNRPKTAVGRSGTFSIAHDRIGIDDVLLAPLLPPNDPTVRVPQRKRQKEEEKKKGEFQRQNAEATLRKCRVNGESRPRTLSPVDARQEPRRSYADVLHLSVSDTAATLAGAVQGESAPKQADVISDGASLPPGEAVQEAEAEERDAATTSPGQGEPEPTDHEDGEIDRNATLLADAEEPQDGDIAENEEEEGAPPTEGVVAGGDAAPLAGEREGRSTKGAASRAPLPDLIGAVAESGLS